MRLTSWLSSVKGNLSRKRGGARRRKPRSLCTTSRQAELLQTRAMLSSVMFDPGVGQLSVTLDGSDSVSASVVSGQVEISINGVVTGGTPAEETVYQLTVTGGDGGHTIDLA